MYTLGVLECSKPISVDSHLPQSHRVGPQESHQTDTSSGKTRGRQNAHYLVPVVDVACKPPSRF